MNRLLCIALFLSLTTMTWGQQQPLTAEGRIVNSESLASDYSEELGPADKLAGLSLLWSEGRYNFANFDLVPDLDWDAHYRDTIPRVLAATTTVDYYQELRRFYAALNDGHSGVNMPSQLRRRFFAKPPVYTRLIEGRVIIDSVNSKKLLVMGLRPGQEILAVDGVEVHEYASENVRPFQSASTPQDLDVRTYAYNLLRGDAEQLLTLQVNDADGRQTLEMPRRDYGGDDLSKPFPEKFSIRDLGDGVLLIDIRSFNDESVLEAFTENFAGFS